ncbi:MAG: RlmE family RNA methyltransferase [Treponema sp.]|nr:RlmE family RNA methyltransferase [Treponema sp.]
MNPYEKPDHWSLRARREGYPARSVYKLQEMDEKFGLLRPASGGVFRVLDLGAAPGSWSLYALRRGSALELTAADLLPLSRQYDQGLFGEERFRFVRGDITLPEIRRALLERGPFNLIISDAAPATTGNRGVDALRSLELAEAVLDYAESLAAGGGLVVKIFQGGDAASVLRRIRERFASGKSFKPRTCRPGSVETYYIGLGKRENPGRAAGADRNFGGEPPN